MRRVVVTALDGHAARLRRRADLAAHPQGRERRQARSKFDVSDLACKIACEIPRGDGTDGTYNPDQWMEPKEQRKVDEFIVYRDVRGRSRRSTTPAGIRQTLRGADARPAC